MSCKKEECVDDDDASDLMSSNFVKCSFYTFIFTRDNDGANFQSALLDWKMVIDEIISFLKVLAFLCSSSCSSSLTAVKLMNCYVYVCVRVSVYSCCMCVCMNIVYLQFNGFSKLTRDDHIPITLMPRQNQSLFLEFHAVYKKHVD